MKLTKAEARRAGVKPNTKWTPTVQNCDNYMSDRTGKYEYRAVRYRHAIEWMFDYGLDDSMTVVDVGAGMTEFDYCLRKEFDWRGRYIPIDGGIDGTNLESWVPARSAHFFVALELLEHLNNWRRLLFMMQQYATVGVAISTPNPATTDVLGMDPTHVTEVYPYMLGEYGMTVTEETFYGGVFSEGKPDSLFGTWVK
jgi:hypothetical protein